MILAASAIQPMHICLAGILCSPVALGIAIGVWSTRKSRRNR
jgi:hypothetical protein